MTKSKLVKIDTLNRLAVTNIFEEGDWVVCRRDKDGNVYLEKIGSDDILFVGMVKKFNGRCTLHVGRRGVRALSEEFGLDEKNRYIMLHENGGKIFVRKVVLED